MRRTVRSLWLAFLLVPGSLAAEAAPFEFPVPEGFVSLKDTSNVTPMTRIDDRYFEQAKLFQVYAVHVGPDGVDASYLAKVLPGTAPLLHLPDFGNEAVQSSGIKEARILSSRLVEVAGVRSGRIEVGSRVDDAEWRQLLYVLPGRTHWALVRLSAHKDAYERVALAVDAAIPQARGLTSQAEKPNPGVVTSGDGAQAKLGGMFVLAGLGGYLLNKLVRRRKPAPRRA